MTLTDDGPGLTLLDPAASPPAPPLRLVGSWSRSTLRLMRLRSPLSIEAAGLPPPPSGSSVVVVAAPGIHLQLLHGNLPPVSDYCLRAGDLGGDHSVGRSPTPTMDDYLLQEG
ncbi:hypothetical protein ZWY2020_058917 [Hordeum vulgare]|nr:hypothetical protein ZWY2020_058917 [Hordeum vulgare]